MQFNLWMRRCVGAINEAEETMALEKGLKLVMPYQEIFLGEFADGFGKTGEGCQPREDGLGCWSWGGSGFDGGKIGGS